MDMFQNRTPIPDANVAFAAAHLYINILEKYHRQGWKRKLITTAVEYLREQNVEGAGVSLGLDPSNSEAKKFYERVEENKMGPHRIDKHRQTTRFINVRDSTAPFFATIICVSTVLLKMASGARDTWSYQYSDSGLQSPPPAATSNVPRRKLFAQPMEQGYQVPPSSMAATLHPTPRPENLMEPQWQIPIYDTTQQHSPAGVQSPEEFPSRRISDPTSDDARRTSDMTLSDVSERDKDDHYARYSFSSYQHPYDIQPPQDAYSVPGGSATQSSKRPSARRRSVSFSEKQPTIREYIPYEDEETDAETERSLKKRGIPSNMLDLYTLNAQSRGQTEMQRQGSDTGSDGYAYISARNFMRRRDSAASTASGGSDMLDPDDPRVTGVRAKYLEDPEDIEKHTLRGMDYRTRRKHRRRVKIEFNVSCICPSTYVIYQV